MGYDIIKSNTTAVDVRQKRTEVSLMLKKIIIRMSRDEFEVLEQMIVFWINIKKCETLEEKAIFMMLFVNIYKKKIMTNSLKLTQNITLNLTLPEAFCLDYVMGDIYLSDRPYEQMLSDKITSEIFRQTL